MSTKIRRDWNCNEKIKTFNYKYVYTNLLLGVSAFVESHLLAIKKYIKIFYIQPIMMIFLHIAEAI
jgi:hypothetical protein